MAVREKIVGTCKTCEGRGRKLVALSADTLELQDCACLTRLREIVPLYKAGIPEKYHNLRIDDFHNKQNQAYLRIVRVAQKIVPMCDAGLGIYLNGGNGSGKTYLAACLLKLAIKNGKTGVFLPMSTLLELFWKSRGDEEIREWLNDLVRMDLIVLDEIEKIHIGEKGYEFNAANMLIGNLYNHGVSLIVTANCERKSLTNKFGRAVTDRFEEMLIEIRFMNRSFRKKALESKLKEAGMEDC